MAAVKSENKRIGIFGGTYNPVHHGHLRAAEEVRQAFVLDKVYLVPSGRPPHKIDAGVASAEERLAMVRRARRGNPFLACSAFECRRGETSYSVATIEYFQRRFPAAELFFIIGWDAWNEIGTWYAFPGFFAQANFVVISRQGRQPWLEAGRDALFPFALENEFCYEKESTYRHVSGRGLYFMEVTRLDISSSLVRGEAAAGRSLRYLVPAAVASYILKNRIYFDD
ncbi:MAG TPA: nicotinate (nicotinamide) nucleotide adenylyltransferase [Proteobacteria bacterium]|nr:nicotinate (nicotinamide) nucleotide adenylyltransferase [Pseudomonadota bacterium]